MKFLSSLALTIGLPAIVACAAQKPLRPPVADQPIAPSPPQFRAESSVPNAQNRTAQADDRQQQKPLVPSPDCIAATRELAWDFGREQLGIERLALVAAPHFPIEGEAEASIEDAQGAITSHGFTESYDERYWYWLGLSDEIGVGHLAVSTAGDLELSCAGRFDCTGVQEHYQGSLAPKVLNACGGREPSNKN